MRTIRDVSRCAWGLVLASSLGCGAEPAPALFRLELPSSASTRAAVIAFERADGVELHATPIGPDGAITPVATAVDLAGSVRVVALFYEVPLEELGLATGRIATSTASSASAASTRPVPPPAAIQAAALAAGRLGGWTPESALDPALARVTLPAVEPCGAFEETRIALDSRSAPRFVLVASETGVFVGTDDDRLFYVERSGAVELHGPVGRMSQPIPFYGGLRDGRGNLWLGSTLGGVWMGSVQPAGCDAASAPCRELEATEVGILTAADEIYGLAGPDDASELFGLAEGGSVERFDGTEWLRIYDFTGASTFRGSVAWVGPDEVIAASAEEAHVVRYRAGALTSEVLFADDPKGVPAVTHLTGWGSAAGDLAGRVFTHHGDAWASVATSGGAAAVEALAGYSASSFVWVDSAGGVEQHVGGRGACPRVAPIDAGDRGGHLTVVGRDVVVVGPHPGGRVAVRWLRRTGDQR